MNELVPSLQVRNVSKSYANCLANNQINLTIQRGEIHALLGENGAGKSTLMKIIYGLVRPDAGEIFWEGEKVNFKSPAQARMLGVGMVFQHFSLFETLTVTENIALALPKTEKWDLSRVDRKIRILSNEYGLSVNPDRPIYTLAVGERQRVEVIRCLFQSTKLLILDEPTAVLTPQEIEKLFVILRQIAANGCSILFSSHKLKEVQSLCSHATVLRNGAVVQECILQEETPASLARMMIGNEGTRDWGLGTREKRQAETQIRGLMCLHVQDLCLKPKNPFGTALQHIDLQLHIGEIVGIAGVAGNGQSELLSALSGEVICPKAEMIMLGEMPIGNCDVSQRRRLGLAYAPEDRLSKGVVQDMSLQENALLTAYGQGLVRRGMIRYAKLKSWTVRICAAFNVKQAGVNSTAGSLSGGNLQKFIMGREINQNPAVLIVAHPTWGVDVNATASIHEALIEMRNNGAVVLVISEDLDELFDLCDRLGVIYKGQLSPLKSIQETSRDEIGRLMGGIGFDRLRK